MSDAQEINPKLRQQWEIARRAKAYNKDRKTEEFDPKEIAEDLTKSLNEIQPGLVQINVLPEFDKSRLKEHQWEKYLQRLFQIHEGWRSFDFRLRTFNLPLPEDSSIVAYELSKDVNVKHVGNLQKVLRYLNGFLMPESIHHADILSVRMVDPVTGKILYEQGYASPKSRIRRLVKTDYKEKKPFYEAITLKNMERVERFYHSQVGHYVVKDSEKRNVSARIAVESGEGFVTRGEYIYSLGIKDQDITELSEVEKSVLKYFSDDRKCLRVKEVSQDLGLDFHNARMALVNLWKRCLLNRRRNDFIFTSTDGLASWGVHDNKAYQFIWNSNRSGEKYPSKIPFDFDPSTWVDYPISRGVVNDFVMYLVQYGFKPRLRTTGGKLAHAILNLEFNRIPVNFDNPFPRDEKLEKIIRKDGNEGLVIAAANDFMRRLALDFGFSRSKPTPITLETYNVAERLHNIYIDHTRCYPNTGVRSLGSIHQKLREGGSYVCIPWNDDLLPQLPKNEKEIRSRSTMDYVFRNPEILAEPEYSVNENPFSLVEETFERTSWIPPVYIKNPIKFYVRNIRTKSSRDGLPTSSL